MGLSYRVGWALPADGQQWRCHRWYGRRGACGNACHRYLKPAVNAPASNLQLMRRTRFGCLWSVISTAAGVGVASMRDALAPQLAAILAERRGCTVAWTATARTGATASFTARELVPEAPFDQDISVVLVGVNDVLRMTPRRTWRASMDRLVDALEKHVRPGGQIMLAGLPNLGKFRTFPQPLRAVLAWHSRALDRELRQIASHRPVVTRVAMPPVSWPEMCAEDRFHPNAARRVARWPPISPPRSPHTAEWD
jgi:hypothetical protein